MSGVGDLVKLKNGRARPCIVIEVLEHHPRLNSKRSEKLAFIAVWLRKPHVRVFWTETGETEIVASENTVTLS